MKRIFVILVLLINSYSLMSSRQRGGGIDSSLRLVETIVIKNCKLIDGTGAEPKIGMTIFIQGERFSAILPDAEADIPKKARVIDAGGRAVVPGLIDAHFHMCYPDSREQPFELNEALAAFRAEYFLYRHLMGGITTVMDAGAYKNVGFMAKKAFAEGHFIGSRPVVVGERINATGGHGVSRFPMAYEADGPDEWRKAVRTQIKNGADLIKILPPYTKEELAAGIDEAHRLKKMVAVHSGYLNDTNYIRWAVELNADVIEHAYQLPDDVIEMMGQKKIYATPTMTCMIYLHQPAGVPLDESVPHRYEIIFQKLKKAGVRMAIGTDAIYEVKQKDPGLYFDEVERFVKNGYTPLEAISAATKIGAEVIGVADRLGTIEPNKIADLLIIDGDPSKNIKELRKIVTIIQGGKIIKNDLLKNNSIENIK